MHTVVIFLSGLLIFSDVGVIGFSLQKQQE
jgi:hypothetical protein